jgi:class 3 adenylate cyclase
LHACKRTRACSQYVLQAHGGDVLKFAGDALLVAWPLDAGASDSEAACAAAACALAMLSMQASAPAEGEPPLSLHIALHVGQLVELHVGNGDAPGGRWEHFVAGEPLAALAPLIAAAAPGECVASHALWALIRDGATAGSACVGGARVAAVTAPLPATCAAVSDDDPPSEAVLAALASYLPPALADTLEAGQQRWMAELRHVSVLFMLLPPCGADDFALAQELIAEVHRCVQRGGGACQQSLADDKGTVSVAVWGKVRARCCGCTACVAMCLRRHRGEATQRMRNFGCADASALRPQQPPASHADDPARAVAAATELAASLARIAAAHDRHEATISCGVTTGRAFCGNVGSASRCEWAVVGDVVRARRARTCCKALALTQRPFTLQMNNAARLMASAVALNRAVLCCAVTMQHVAASLTDNGDALPSWLSDTPLAVVLKGAAQPMTVYAPMPADVPSSPRAQPPPRTAPSESPCSNSEPRRTSSGKALLGREVELARVEELLEAKGDGALLIIAGGVSSGKSSFLRAAGDAAFAHGRAVLPLAPACSGAFDTPWMAACIEAHVDSLPQELRPLAPLLAELVPSAGLTAAALATPDSAAALAALEDTEAALCALAIEVLRPVIAGTGAVLLSDDASALDPLSATVLSEVHAVLRPAVLLTLPRQELEDPASVGSKLVSALAEQATAFRAVTLGPLPPAAVGQLCASELEVAVDSLPAGLVPALMRLGGGHPLLLKEQLALLLRQGHLRVGAGGEVHAVCDLATLPDLIARGLTEENGIARMEVFVQRGLDSLGPEARAAVRAAAVLGGDWDLALIARCCGEHFSFAAICAAAAELVREGMWAHAPPLAGDDGGSSSRYMFTHSIVRSLVFAATPEDTRAELHAVVLSRLEQRASAAGGGPQLAATWADWARLSRGASLHFKSATFSLAAARSSMSSVVTRHMSDASRFAQEGMTSLRDAAEHAAETHEGCDEPPRRSGSGGRFSQHTAAPRKSEENLLRSGSRRRSSGSVVATSPAHAALWRDLSAVLVGVRHVQASWAPVELNLQAHAQAMTHAFVARCPSALELVRSNHGLLLTDPSMAPILQHHQATLLTLVGSCVAGQRDLEALAPILQQCGRMHARFSAHMRAFLPGMGVALLDTLRASVLNEEELTPEVETAWAAVYNFAAQQLVIGLKSAEASYAAEHTLWGQLLGSTACLLAAVPS